VDSKRGASGDGAGLAVVVGEEPRLAGPLDWRRKPILRWGRSPIAAAAARVVAEGVPRLELMRGDEGFEAGLPSPPRFLLPSIADITSGKLLN